MLKILGKEREIKKLDAQNRAILLLHMLQRLFGTVKADLRKYICKFYNIPNEQVNKLNENLLSILETLEVKK